MVPFLLALATFVFAFGDRLKNVMEKHAVGAGAAGHVGTIAVAIYGGYFTVVSDHAACAVFALGMRDLNQMNGLKNGCPSSCRRSPSRRSRQLASWPGRKRW